MTISNGGSVSETGFDLAEFLKARLDEAEAKVRGWRTFRPDVPEHDTEELHHVDGSTSISVTLPLGIGHSIMTEAEYEAWTTEPAEPDHQELRRIEGLRAITRDADEFVREFELRAGRDVAAPLRRCHDTRAVQGDLPVPGP